MFEQITPIISICIWVAVVILAIIVEASTYQLVSIWFAAAGFISLLLAVFKVGFEIQLIVFIVVALLMLFLTRPLVKKLTKNSKIEGTAEGLVEEVVEVTKEIPVDGVGEVKARYEKYNAISKFNTLIPVGTKVKIVEINGNKVIVEKI